MIYRDTTSNRINKEINNTFDINVCLSNREVLQKLKQGNVESQNLTIINLFKLMFRQLATI